MGKLMILFTLFRRGTEISNVERWKKHQIDGNIVGGFILALVAAAKAFGYEFPIDEASALIVGGSVVAIVNVVLTTITSKRVGLLPEKPNSTSDSEQPQKLPGGEADMPKDSKPDNRQEDADRENLYFG